MLPTDNNAPPDKSNVQGMIMRGFTHPCSCHMIFQFSTRTGAKSFIHTILPKVQSAEDWGDDKPDSMLNIGLTFTGIKMVSDLNDGALGNFPAPYKLGPASDTSQQSLNDWGKSSPRKWLFGFGDENQVDCVVHCYGLTTDALGQLVSLVSAAATAGRLKEFLPIDNGTKRLEEYATVPRNSIHFGYLDGIDQPPLGWSNPPNPQDNGDLRNFLVGYPLSAAGPGPVGGPEGDFAKDGCYNAFRMLYQDVQAFDNFLNSNAGQIAKDLGETEDYAKEWLAAKLNGRWRKGSPLELSPDAPDPETSEATKFLYGGDKNGMKCPFAAHNRVADPRDEPLAPNEPNPAPRLIRRGMAYGTPPVGNNYDGDRGLIGLFLCGTFSRQFELIYSWMNATNFSTLIPVDMLKCQDGLLGNRSLPGANLSYTIPTEKGPIKIKSLPQFVITKGTAYCLLPSISTLKLLAG